MVPAIVNVVPETDVVCASADVVSSYAIHPIPLGAPAGSVTVTVQVPVVPDRYCPATFTPSGDVREQPEAAELSAVNVPALL